MIGRLTLERFGKFAGVSFDFGPVTLFHGPNEAGKSTIFDALCFALCGYKKNYPGLERYGDSFSVRAEFTEPAPEPFLHTELSGIYAVKSDAVSLPKGEAKWLDRIKHSFFSGGLDPELMARDIDKVLNSTKRRQEEEGRKRALASAREGLERAKAELETAKAARAAADRTRTLLEAARARTAERRNERDACRRAVELGSARARLAEARHILARVERLRFLMSAPGAVDESAQAAALEEALKQSRLALAAAEAAMGQAGARAAQASERRATEEEAGREAERRGTTAREIADKLEPRSLPREIRERRAGAASILSLAFCALLALGAAALLYLSGRGWAPALSALSGGLAAGLILFTLLRRRVSRADEEECRQALSEARAEWARRMPGADPLPASDAREYWERLRALEAEAGRRAGLLEEARREEARARAAQSEAVRAYEAALAAVQRDQGTLAEWLQARGAASYRDYVERAAQASAQAREAEALRQELAAEAKRSGASGPDELAARARHDIESIEERWPEAAAAQAQGQVAESERLRQAEDALAQAADEEARLAAAWERESALAEKDRRGMLAALERAQEELAAAESACARDSLERAAEGIARDIFLDMARDSDAAFRGLSAAVERLYSLAAGGPGRDCALPSLNMEAAKVADSGGTLRAPAELSLGTRDLFYLACRLALAKSLGRERAVLVFDEAFKNLDRKRVLRALGMIAAFREETGWQLVFMTKDVDLADSLGTVFPSDQLRRYDL